MHLKDDPNPTEAAAEALFHAESGRNGSWVFPMTWDRLPEETREAYRSAAGSVVDAYLDASAASLRSAA
jgi:hypothetical protein